MAATVLRTRKIKRLATTQEEPEQAQAQAGKTGLPEITKPSQLYRLTSAQRQEWYAACDRRKAQLRGTGVHLRNICIICNATVKPMPGKCDMCGTSYDEQGNLLSELTGKPMPKDALDELFPEVN